MKMKGTFSCLTMAATVLLIASANYRANAAVTCESLASLPLADATITFAKSIPAGTFTAPDGEVFTNMPAFCEVQGVAKPTSVSAIKFEVWMPASGWNGKFEGVGNGGLAGTIVYSSMVPPLQRGFATAGTDTGHSSTEPQLWLQNRQLIIDYSYRGLHEMTTNSKAAISAFYQQSPAVSLYSGCSTGGKEGLYEAQLYPDDYDGIVAGDPANFWTHVLFAEVWVGQATDEPATTLSDATLQILHNSVLKACDGLDGVIDGLITDPRQCHFNPRVLQCKGSNTSNCLTAAQIGAIDKIYQGPVNPRTYQSIFPGYSRSSEVGWGSAFGTPLINRTTTSGVSSYDFFRFAVFDDPNWDFRTLNFDSDVRLTDNEFASIMNATSPDLGQFQKLGHKLIQYHGFSDPLAPTLNSLNYYESVVADQAHRPHTGDPLKNTQDFYRLFLAPGMYHCGSGPGPNVFNGVNNQGGPEDPKHDVVSALDRWVEDGVAPDQIIATHYTNGVADNTRPMCPFPQFARYNGHGPTNEASSYVCAYENGGYP
ncbi:MAG: tannase/feruloyl esterase family alpha/beta hydrolase [Stellaceae bacterium]